MGVPGGSLQGLGSEGGGGAVESPLGWGQPTWSRCCRANDARGRDEGSWGARGVRGALQGSWERPGQAAVLPQ